MGASHCARAGGADGGGKKKKKGKKKKGKKGEDGHVKDEFDVRESIKEMEIHKALRKKKQDFVMKDILPWQMDCKKFEKFRLIEERLGRKAPPKPTRPVFNPVLSPSDIKYHIEQGVVAEMGQREKEK